MAEELDSCNVPKKALAPSNCNKMPGLPISGIETPVNWFIPADTLAAGADAVKAYIQAALVAAVASRVFKWPTFFTVEDQSEETTYQTTPVGKRKVRDGFYEWKFGISESLCLHKAMFSHRGTAGRFFLYDNENRLIGTKDSDGNFYGLSYQMLNTEKMKFNDGSVVSTSPVVLTLKNNLEFDRDGAIIDASFVNTLTLLVDVVLTITDEDTTDIVVSVLAECDDTPLNGLVLADFVLTDENGDAQTGFTVSETGDGVYTLHKTSGSFVAGFLDLAEPAALTVQAYEAVEAVSVLGGS